MSKLPEWLWPLEDEEAVQEAERLIEETHNALQRMEADMKVQHSISQVVAVKTEKLKCAVNNKIKTLEKELKGFSESKTIDQPVTEKPTQYAEQIQGISSSKQSKENAPIRYSGLSNNLFKTQRDPPKTHNLSPPKSQRTEKSKRTVNVAEKVVLSARSKVEDALTVARNVAASLDQRLSSSSLPSKPLAYSQAANIGVFEVKSKAYEKNTPAPKQRLKQADLPAISIKRNLDMQTIPTVQVSPGDKLTPANAFVYNIKYTEKDEMKGECPKDTNFSKKSECSKKEYNSTIPCSASGFQIAIAELSKQLAQVEELREVNQAQVNHVLEFLMSRVCTTASPSEKCSNKFVHSTNQGSTLMSKTLSLPSTSSTSSESSNYPIAYDSLSRFLETYKKAAEQNMLARKRAASQRQKVALKQKKDIEQVEGDRTHHLLIGPLRQTPRLSRTDSPLPEQDLDDNAPSTQQFGGSLTVDNCQVLKDDNLNPINIGQYHASSSEQDFQPSSSSNLIRDSGHSTSDDLPPKLVEGLTGDEYEDDWEEEEDLREENVEATNSVESSLEPILEVEERMSSLSNSVNPQPVLPQTSLNTEKSLNIISLKNIGLEESRPNLGEKNSGADQLLSTNELPMVPLQMLGENITIGDGLEESPILNVPSQAPALCHSESESGNQGPASESSKVLGACVYLKESLEVVKDFQKSDDQHKVQDFVAPGGSKEACDHKNYQKNVKGKEQQSLRKRIESRHRRLSSSSSDTESKSPSRKTNHMDLRLRDDLHLQSAMLLNWQLEERWRSRNRETASVREPSTPSHENAFIADVERRWQRTLDQLDQRLKTIEDNERIERVALKIRMQSREKLSRVPVIVPPKNADEVESSHIKDNIISFIGKASTKDQMVQTSPDKMKTVEINKEKPFSLSGLTENRAGVHDFYSNRLMKSQTKGPSLPLCAEDLTAELLTFSKMKILPRQQPVYTKSPSSSTSSSQLQQSSLVVSWSDGELQGSVNGSCSCSEGEFCLCGGRKLCMEHAPPDGSQTFSDGENVFRHVSQGEIPFSDIKNIHRDTSNGEIADHSSLSLPHGDLDADDGLESDSIEWN